MMAPEALNLGFELHVLAEGPDVSAARSVPDAPVGDYKDLETLREFAKGKDVVTFDHEHVPNEFLTTLINEGVNIQPRPAALIHAQDKLVMREAIEKLGLPNPAWAKVGSVDELVAFGDEIGWPIVLKTPRGGYDGKGVRILDDAGQARDSADWFENGPLLAEDKVDFSRELSAMVARTPSGQAKAWPVVHTIQVDGVCDEVIAPAQDISEDTARTAANAALRIAEEFGVTGVMAAELFETPGVGAGFVINELAMRPHNTGHWTMNGSVTSQFEQHLRAVLDLPLGETRELGVTVMKNYLGGANQDLYSAFAAALAAAPEVKVHAYGKSVRPGRKIGHVNIVANAGQSVDELRQRADLVAALIRDGVPATA
ncbi:5-(carboxyamino)imidazole ribonucleotide synthase [Glutamicibacter protophormiae]|uniref:N5-carboxyaminoimidazole ribonucleotide synthase n=2 Tax=Glutamicibacter protophormiae TaxID=37930 RepID=A0ABS4XQA7_GLUPR|nr:5-(carboxyamino)imidazole ribonucleotide synthase [Glutamicibacter protophormiae]GGL81671.1 N5-carboxyaminoimidazole ribonucleotide synthase [Glutamicibacter protophormiae]